MNTLIDKLKNDTFSGIFELSGKAWMPTLIAYVVYSILAMVLFLPIIMGLLNFSMDDIANLQELSNDPFAMSRELEAMSENFATMITPTSYGLILLGILGAMLISSWTYLVAFISTKSVINDGKVDIGKVLSASFNKKILKLFLAFLAIMIVSTVGFIFIVVVAGFLGNILGDAIGGLIAFAGIIGWIAFHWRLSLSMPIVAYEDVTIGEAFSISISSVTWRKAFKYTLLSFLACIVFAIAGGVMALILGLIGSLPVIGAVIGPIINMVISAFFLTLMVATLVALYYKYRGIDFNGDSTIEDHLLYEN